MSEWVRTYENGLDHIESLGGVSWGDRGTPGWLHRCRPQTRGRFGGDYTERCNCGATRLSPSGPWIDRNETRRSRRRQRKEDRLPRVTPACRDCGKRYEAAEGTAMAREELCTACWAGRLVKDAGPVP